MSETPRRIGRRIALWAGAVVLVLVVAVAGLYLADTPVEAEVKESRCGSGEVDLLTAWPLPGLTHTVTGLDNLVCQLFVDPGSYVVYHVRSEHTLLYEDSSKECLKYDSGADGERERTALPGQCLQ